jgi:hypothetical protein
MRTFTLEDGTTWTVRLHDGIAQVVANRSRIGWEIIEFDPESPTTLQRIAYRPPGWLLNASLRELIDALREADAVRSNWRK